jgi:ABC-type transporter MlaC component
METYRSVDPLRGALAALAAVLIVLASPPAGAEEGPMQVIEKSNTEILELYADEGDAPDVSQRVFDVMDEVTSFDSIADAAIDGLCDPAADDDCERFKEVFKELLRVSSVQKLGRYRADRFDYLGEDIDGDAATVRTLAHYGDDAIEVDYSLRRQETGWVIDNYVVDGVDTIRNYRKQFSRMLGDRPVDFVIERLERRTEELREAS